MPFPAWATDPYSLLITQEEYEALPEDVSKAIEVVDGSVVVCESPSPEHQRIMMNLCYALKAARPSGGPCIDVLPDTDVYYVEPHSHISDKARRFTMRRPDISILHCIERGSKLTSADVFTAVEIAGSDSRQRDFQDKKAEYAGQRIPVYLIVVLDAEETINSVEEYRLDWSGRSYQLAMVHRDVLATELPEGMKVNVTFSELESV
ncbi:Uma2 family endonuclease [Actinomadura sp. BRA 177]|uniref:Uma2 family endonuclease n=1 Tax=Actinomadura sp. BRA 177 TaxID=2745202 RepID=UPI001594F2D5|nr:Uma2 family endonuclease [Actinomadura sp. BRA 177]NVI85861.1 Uma2 family endonuclease [Actinomadura sp. BRA 177]